MLGLGRLLPSTTAALRKLLTAVVLLQGVTAVTLGLLYLGHFQRGFTAITDEDAVGAMESGALAERVDHALAREIADVHVLLTNASDGDAQPLAPAPNGGVVAETVARLDVPPAAVPEFREAIEAERRTRALIEEARDNGLADQRADALDALRRADSLRTATVAHVREGRDQWLLDIGARDEDRATRDRREAGYGLALALMAVILPMTIGGVLERRIWRSLAAADALGLDEWTVKAIPGSGGRARGAGRELVVGAADILNLAADIVVVLRINGQVVDVKHGSQEVLACSPELARGRSLFEFVHADDLEDVSAQKALVLDHGAIRNFTCRISGGVEPYRWISWNVVRFEDDRALAVGRDVTDSFEERHRRSELQDAIIRSATEWRATFDAVDTPLLVADADGQIMRMNLAASMLTGADYRDAVGRSMETLLPRAMYAALRDLVTRVTRAGGRPSSTQVQSDDRTWDIDVTPLRTANGANVAIIIAHDVTTIMRMRDSLRSHETMAEIGALTAGVAHEVRNPIFSMTATLDAVESRGLDDPALVTSFTTLRRQLERLQTLMRDLLEYGRPSIQFQHTDVRAVVDDALENNRPAAAAASSALVCNVAPDLPRILGDHGRLVQVFSNLIANAISFSPPRGVIEVRADLVREDGIGRLECAVEDMGSGFLEDDLPYVFDPFYTRRVDGTGLGLAVVRRIVEQHGGAVSASNRHDGGAMVRITLPLPPTSGRTV